MMSSSKESTKQVTGLQIMMSSSKESTKQVTGLQIMMSSSNQLRVSQAGHRATDNDVVK